MTTAPALLREMRASFYRKLFLAFVAAVFVPVVALVLVTRNYVAGQMQASIEQEAVRTASAAGRVVEDLAAPRAAQQGFGVDDNLMVWVSRLIDQDVNIFTGARLLATSERNLFASGLLPTRTPAEVYRALALRNEAGARHAGTHRHLRVPGRRDAARRSATGHPDRAADVAAAGDRSADRDARSPRAAGRAAVHPRRRRHRLLRWPSASRIR